MTEKEIKEITKKNDRWVRITNEDLK